MVNEALSVAKCKQELIQCYTHFVLVVVNDHRSEKGMTEVRQLLTKLPTVNYNLLKYLRYLKVHFSQ